MKTIYAATALVGSIFVSTTTPAAFAAGPVTNEINFRVLLDDKEIGFHKFEITVDGGATLIKINAEFDVKFLFVTAYSYLHENSETWEGGCLRRIDSRTNSNGKHFAVSGERAKDSFELVTLKQARSLEE